MSLPSWRLKCWIHFPSLIRSRVFPQVDASFFPHQKKTPCLSKGLNLFFAVVSDMARCVFGCVLFLFFLFWHVVDADPTAGLPPDNDEFIDSGGVKWALSVVLLEDVLWSTPAALLSRIQLLLPPDKDPSQVVLLGYCAWRFVDLPYPTSWVNSRCMRPPTYASMQMLVTFTVMGTEPSFCGTLSNSSATMMRLKNVSTALASWSCFIQNPFSSPEFVRGSSSSDSGVLPTSTEGRAAAILVVIVFLLALICCVCILYRKMQAKEQKEAKSSGDRPPGVEPVHAAPAQPSLGGPSVAYGRALPNVTYGGEPGVALEELVPPREDQRAAPLGLAARQPAVAPQVSVDPPAPGTATRPTGRVTMDIDY